MGLKAKRFLAGTLLCAAAFAVAAPSRTWRGGDGLWSDPSKWQDGLLPSDGDCTSFGRCENDETVTIDVNARTGYWLIPDGLPGDRQTLTWRGTGTLTNTITSTTIISPHRRLVLDGPEVYIKKAFELKESAELTVRSGRFLVDSGMDVFSNAVVRVEGGHLGTSLTLAPHAAAEVTGGTLWTYSGFTVQTNARVRLAGGTLHVTAAPNGLTADRFSFTGGTLRWANTSAINQNMFHLLPPAGGVLEHRSSSYEAFYVGAAGAASFDGTIVATNRATDTPGFRFYKKNYTLSGKGTLLVDQLYINDGYKVTLKNKKLLLGTGLISRGSAGAVYSFPEGMTFGAWGDWRTRRTDYDYVSNAPTVRLGGDVAFETLDCIDGRTRRTITLARCTDNGLRSLAVSGGGTVDLAFADGLDGLDRIVVGAGTTLALTNTATTIAVRRLKMERGARLLLTAGKAAIEAEGAPELAEDAEIVFTAADVTVGKLHPVWTSADGTPVPAQVTIAGLDETIWTVKTLNGVRYLSDGTVTAVTSTDKAVWLGTNSSLWSVKANWEAGRVCTGSTYGYFCREANLFVTNDVARSCRYFIVTPNAGPYFFSGEQLTLTYPAGDSIKESSNSLRHQSAFPVWVENRLVCSGAHAYFRSVSDASLHLIGGGTSKGTFNIHGDVRLGRDWSGTNIVLLSQDDMKRPSRLTVLPGGTLTLTAPDRILSAPVRLVIDGVFEPSNTLISVEKAGWRGEGAIRLHGVRTLGASSAFELGDALTLYPLGGWPTVSTANPTAGVAIVVRDAPTLGATADWTYGPAAGVVTEVPAADRALTVADGAVLTVDTQDPATGEGHTVTFADPVVGGGSLVKRGAGTLCFATTDSRLGGTFTVAGGRVALEAALAERADREWVPLIAAASFSGLDEALPATLKTRYTADGGLLRCDVRAATGLMLLVR